MNSLRAEKGFTLVETLIAVALVSLALIGPLGLASSGLKAAALAKDKLTAEALAQDGMEDMLNVIITTIRSNDLASTYWLSGLESCEPANNPGSHHGNPNNVGCIVDSTQNLCNSPHKECSIYNSSGVPQKNATIYYDSVTGLYGHVLGSATKFSRLVFLQEIVVGVEASVTTTVSWTDPIYGAQSVVLTENVMNI